MFRLALLAVSGCNFALVYISKFATSHINKAKILCLQHRSLPYYRTLFSHRKLHSQGGSQTHQKQWSLQLLSNRTLRALLPVTTFNIIKTIKKVAKLVGLHYQPILKSKTIQASLHSGFAFYLRPHRM